jgi:sec-independent protein translocase protein TatA
MLGLDNPIHILFLLMIALLVFGAKRLPEMGKSLGEGLRGFKESVSGDTHLAHMTSDHTPAQVNELSTATPMPTQPAPQPATDWATEPRSEQTSVTPVA